MAQKTKKVAEIEAEQVDLKQDEAEQLEDMRNNSPEVELPNEGQNSEVEAEASEDESSDKSKTTKAGKHSAKAQREDDEETARLEAKEHRKEADEAAESEPKAPTRQMPNPLHVHGKKYREVVKLVERTKLYSFDEALDLAVKTATTKFDSSVEVHVNLGVDPRQADQMVRASVVLPHGTGRTLRVAVFADGVKADEATAAGADLVGVEKLVEAIQKGKLDFDLLIATPDKMAGLGKLAKILGPRGLMPNPKSGTVTIDVAKAVKEAKAGKVEFRIDKQAIVHQGVGKVSFKTEDLRENVLTFLKAVLKAKPAAAKGTYVKAISMSTSMGPGIKVDAAATISAISTKR